jgi:diaminopimelate epimerase
MGLSIHLNSLTKAVYSGCGNCFIVTTEWLGDVPLLCQAHGADGLILIDSSSIADFKMRIFNSDGSEVEMCGNGLRCAVKFMLEHTSCVKAHYVVETAYALCPVNVHGELLSVTFPLPAKIEKVRIGGLQGYFLNTGVPHTVFFVDNLEDPAWLGLAPSIRHHPLFAPQGTNVNFVKRGTSLEMRTYERGVEGETLSCGTGTVAAALAAQEAYGLALPLTLLPRSKEALIVDREGDKVLLTAPARFIKHFC